MLSRLPLALLSLAVALFGVWRSALTLLHTSDPVYDLHPGSVTSVLVATGIAFLATIGLLRYGSSRVAFAIFLFGLVVAVTFLAFPTLGVLMLVGALGAAIVWRHRWDRWRAIVPSGAAAASLALALTVLLVMGNQRPLVQCLHGGVSMNGPGSFSADNSRTVAYSSTSGETSHGTVTFGTRTYDFVCRRDRLVHFAKR